MNITYIYDNNKAAQVANQISQARGYEGYSSIDDPGLREWIWHRASRYVRTHTCVHFSVPELLTTAIFCLILGLLLGMMF